MYPSLEHVSWIVGQLTEAVGVSGEGTRAPSATMEHGGSRVTVESGAGLSSPKREPGRLTFASAAKALGDDSVRRAAYGSRAKVLARIWQTGSLARSIAGINDGPTGRAGPHEKLVEWKNDM